MLFRSRPLDATGAAASKPLADLNLICRCRHALREHKGAGELARTRLCLVGGCDCPTFVLFCADDSVTNPTMI